MLDITRGYGRAGAIIATVSIPGLLSGVLDNIVVASNLTPIVQELTAQLGSNVLAWALLFGSCFGGNLTIVAAAANVAASGMAARSGTPIGFMTFMRYGVPVTVVSLVLATGYVMLRYV